jgi:hypothetical protein
MKSKYIRNAGKQWTPSETAQLRQLAKDNTPTRVIGLKLGRPEAGVKSESIGEGDQSEAHQPGSPYAALTMS